jgi:hypothetical protein
MAPSPAEILFLASLSLWSVVALAALVTFRGRLLKGLAMAYGTSSLVLFLFIFTKAPWYALLESNILDVATYLATTMLLPVLIVLGAVSTLLVVRQRQGRLAISLACLEMLVPLLVLWLVSQACITLIGSQFSIILGKCVLFGPV